MPDRSSHQGPPEDWDHGSHAARGPFSTAGAADGYGAGMTASHRARTGPDDAYSAPGTYGARAADPFGEANPFGDADPFGSRSADPFGPSAGGAFGTKPATFAPATA